MNQFAKFLLSSDAKLKQNRFEMKNKTTNGKVN